MLPTLENPLDETTKEAHKSNANAGTKRISDQEHLGTEIFDSNHDTEMNSKGLGKCSYHSETQAKMADALTEIRRKCPLGDDKRELNPFNLPFGIKVYWLSND